MIGTTLHLVVMVFGVIALSTTTGAGAQMLMALCNFQEVSLAPCMAGVGGGNNISCACCSSLNRALDAGHRCMCSLLLANLVFASLVTNLLTLPLLLPLPGCFLYAPSLAACQATTVQQQASAPPAATSDVASTEGAAARVADPPTTPEKKSDGGPEKSEGERSIAGGNGTSEAAPRPGSVSRSNACRRHPGGNAGQGTAAYALTFLTVAAVFWINCIAVP